MAQENSNRQDVEIESSQALSADKILMAEFKYAQETAAQAMEDRHRMVNYYLLIVGVVGNAIAVLAKCKELPGEWLNVGDINLLVVVMLLALFLTGVLYLNSLIRLRWAWFGSAETMNRIKDYYDRHLPALNLKEEAFLWTTESLLAMKLNKSNTIYFSSALLIIGINALSLSGAVYFQFRNIVTAFFAFTFFVVLEILYYRIMLKRKKSL